MCKISIIIPSYKPEKDLIKRCLDSIANQSFNDYEVILVGDGNTEEEQVLTKEVCKCYDFATYVNVPHVGLSAARNYGLSFAKGNYITYVDADDALTTWFLEEAYETIRKYEADYVIGCIQWDKDEIDPDSLRKEFSSKVHIYSREQIGRKCTLLTERIQLSEDVAVHIGPVALLVKSEIAKKVLFDENITYGEDLIWRLDLLEESQKVVALESVWYIYYYVSNKNSLTNGFDPLFVDKTTILLNEVKKRLDLNDDVMKAAYGDQVWRNMHDVSKKFLCRKQYSESGIDKKKIERILKSEPWNYVAQTEYRKVVSRKCKIKSLLYRCGIWLKIQNVKNRSEA